MLKIYPIPEGVKKCDHFAVKVNGQVAETYSCIVSAIPFNRLWPGYQRPLDQTEEASFIYFDTDEVVNIELEACKDFSELKIRPLSKNIKADVDGRKISFSAGEGQYTVELDGHHNALHIFVNPIKDYGVDTTDSNVIYFGAGVHKAGNIQLKSGQTLFLDGGAVVHGTICAEDCDNIRILGRGILDVSSFERFEPTPMRLIRCKNTLVDGIIFKDANEWTLTAINCENLIIDNTKAIGMWRYNADGYDMCNCANVIIRNSFIRTFDDSIVFKGIKIREINSDKKNVENHLVDNCVIWCDWGRALEIGAETCADEYSNITYKNCDIIHSEAIVLDIQNGDRANIHDVVYDDIRVEYSKYCTGGLIQETDEHTYQPHKDPHVSRLLNAEIYKCMWSQDEAAGQIHDIKYKNITVTMDEGLRLPPNFFKGMSEDHLVQNISIENLVINGKRYVDKSELVFETNEFAENIILK